MLKAYTSRWRHKRGLDRFTDADIAVLAGNLKDKIAGWLDEANARMKKLRRGSLTPEDVALIGLIQRKSILANNGYCGTAMIRGFVKKRKKTRPEQKYFNAHHIKEAFNILEMVGFSRKIADAVYVRNDKSNSRCRRFELCCAPNLVSTPVAAPATVLSNN